MNVKLLIPNLGIKLQKTTTLKITNKDSKLQLKLQKKLKVH